MTQPKCASTTKSGQPCRGKPLDGSTFCFAHQPAKAEPKPQPPEVKEEPKVCGHINRHSYGANGKHDNLSCTLPPGHQGNHGAMHYEVKYYPVVGGPGGVMEEGERWAEWSNMAGIPVEQIKVDKPKPKTVEELVATWTPK